LARSKDKHTLYFETLEALQGGRCAACSLGKRAAHNYLDTLAYENVNNPTTRERTRKAQGLCRTHAWHLRHNGGVPGMFLVYRDVVRDVAEALASAEPEKESSAIGAALAKLRPSNGGSQANASLVAELQPEGDCPACEQQREAEAMYTDVLLEHLREPEFQEAFTKAGGICLSHLRLALERARGGETSRLLRRLERDCYARLLQDLDTLISRLDFFRREEGWADVAYAGIRALTVIAGEDGLT